MSKCSIPGCSKEKYNLEYCDMHRKRAERHGDPNYIPPNQRNHGVCIMSGCSRQARAKQMCNHHYTREYNKNRIKYLKRLETYLIGKEAPNTDMSKAFTAVMKRELYE